MNKLKQSCYGSDWCQTWTTALLLIQKQHNYYWWLFMMYITPPLLILSKLIETLTRDCSMAVPSYAIYNSQPANASVSSPVCRMIWWFNNVGGWLCQDTEGTCTRPFREEAKLDCTFGKMHQFGMHWNPEAQTSIHCHDQQACLVQSISGVAVTYTAAWQCALLNHMDPLTWSK